ncbi:MAG TPA: hypothetical protein VGK31_02775, partial [Thermoanaerobaculia bacterium]
MKKFLALMYATTLLLALACGGGKETTSKEEEGEDDQAAQPTSTAVASTAATTAAPAAAAADAATITGVAKLEGAPPKMPAIQMSADPYCQSQHPTAATDEEVVTGPGGELANVIVYVKNAPSAAPSSTPLTLDQHGCQYHPHVSVIEVGQPLQIKNSDATLHNIHALPNVNSQFNEGQPVQGMVSTKKFDKPEIV